MKMELKRLEEIWSDLTYKGEKIMKKIIKKITAMAVMSLFAATQLQTPQVNVQAADGVATAEKQRQNSQRSMEDQELLLMRNQERFCMQRR